jgi:hypothetical protein
LQDITSEYGIINKETQSFDKMDTEGKRRVNVTQKLFIKGRNEKWSKTCRPMRALFMMKTVG